MIVRLTVTQADHLVRALPSDLKAWIDEGTWWDQGNMVEIEEIPDFWLAVVNFALGDLFVPGRHEPYPKSLHAAVKRISKAVNQRWTHPAFRNEGLVGSHFEWLPAWNCNDENCIGYSPFWKPDHHLVTLYPSHYRSAGTWTQWDVWMGIPIEVPLYQQETYERFRSSCSSGRAS